MVDTTLYKSGVYAITSIACGRIYVGSSIDIGRRWLWHRNELRRGRHKTAKLQQAWHLYGEDNFSFAILEMVQGKDALLDREQFWLDFLEAADYGFNMLHIVDKWPQWTPERRAAMSVKLTGRPVSTETRQKLRQANLGKTYSEESKEKRRVWSSGRKMSPEAIAKTAAYWTGRKHSPEAREKMSQARKAMYANGCPHPWKGRKHLPETIAKLAGRLVSQETRLKQSIARKARSVPRQ